MDYSGEWRSVLSSKNTKAQSLWKEEEKAKSDFKRMEEAEQSVVVFWQL